MSNDVNLKTSGTKSRKSKATIIVSALVVLLVIGGAAFYFSQAKGTQGLIRMNSGSKTPSSAQNSTVLGTSLSAAGDLTGLDGAAKTGMKLAKIKFSASLNNADASENKATLQKIRVRVATTNASANNYIMYPDEQYNNSDYAIKGTKITDKVVEFDFTSNPKLASSLYSKIVEGLSVTYTIKADVVNGTNGNINIFIANTGSKTTNYPTTSDILWMDNNGNISSQVNQDGKPLHLRFKQFFASTGTPTSAQVSTVLGTSLSAAGDLTGLDGAAKTGMKLAKIKFSASLNNADASENKATLQKIRVTTSTANMSADNYLLFPDDSNDSQYNNTNYSVKGTKVTNNIVEFDLTSNAKLTSSAYASIVEGQTRTYSIKADVISGTNGSIELQIAKLGSSTAIYGTNSDVQWTDGKNSSAWVNNTISSLPLRYFSQAASSGIPKP